MNHAQRRTLREIWAVLLMLAGFGIFAYGGLTGTPESWAIGIFGGVLVFGLGVRVLVLLAVDSSPRPQ